jgi:hypothetical protein
MRLPDEPSLHLAAWGAAHADFASLQPMRKAIPAWVPEGTPGHFLKHADEQTVLAVAAIDRAVQALHLPREHFADWSIVAAPRCIGRLSGAYALDRFAKSGAPGISPHLIPQHSLHSVSGAMSILLGSRQPNFGVGGSGDSLAEGLFASLTIPGAQPPGVWFIATGWEPEPELDERANIVNEPCCCAIVLALQRAASNSRGQVAYRTNTSQPHGRQETSWSPDLLTLSRALGTLPFTGASFAWALAWGGAIVLNVPAASAGLSAAA